MSIINSREFKIAAHLREFHWQEISDFERAAVTLCISAAVAGEATVPFWVASKIREADAAIACCEVTHV